MQMNLWMLSLNRAEKNTMSSLNANNFKPGSQAYHQEFEKILVGIVSCYQTMLKDRVLVPNNNEEKIRDIIKKYLNDNNFREINQLNSYLFEAEPLEGLGGKVDIKVMTRNTFEDTDSYYIIECKRLNDQNTSGTSGLNGKYIENGVMRFTSNKYSAHHGVNGMIGFVVKEMDIDKNINKINTLLSNPRFKNANTIDKLTKKSLNKFLYCYQSKHKDSQKKTIDIYHLMLDFSDNITPSIKK